MKLPVIEPHRGDFTQAPAINPELTAQWLEAFLRDELVAGRSIERAVVGLSGGVDSAVTAYSVSYTHLPHLNPVPGDINALAGETVANFRAAHPNVDFTLALDPAIPLIPIDRDAMKRALVNLLDNAVAAVTAINHNGAGPLIEVRSHRRPDNSIVTLEVADNGPGIDPRLRTRIFEPYYSGKKGGTGLGLCLLYTSRCV